MLSKFGFFGNGKSIIVRPEWLADLESRVREFFGSATEIVFVPRGTLSVCAHLRIGARRRFLKTHLPGEACRLNLAKEAGLLACLYEAGLLACLYSELMSIEQVTLQVLGEGHLCLIMDELDPLALPLEPDAAASLIVDCVRRLADYPSTGMERFPALLAAGGIALEELVQAKQIGGSLRDEIAGRFSLLRREVPHLTPAICHGDYGPRNIMAKDGVSVVIDWEDAFEGVAGYDFLYWLSFLENRKFYPAILGGTPYGGSVELAMLMLIVTLKSALSIRSGTHLTHRVPIEVRLREIVELKRQGLS